MLAHTCAHGHVGISIHVQTLRSGRRARVQPMSFLCRRLQTPNPGQSQCAETPSARQEENTFFPHFIDLKTGQKFHSEMRLANTCCKSWKSVSPPSTQPSAPAPGVPLPSPRRGSAGAQARSNLAFCKELLCFQERDKQPGPAGHGFLSDQHPGAPTGNLTHDYIKRP